MFDPLQPSGLATTRIAPLDESGTVYTIMYSVASPLSDVPESITRRSSIANGKYFGCNAVLRDLSGLVDYVVAVDPKWRLPWEAVGDQTPKQYFHHEPHLEPAMLAVGETPKLSFRVFNGEPRKGMLSGMFCLMLATIMGFDQVCLVGFEIGDDAVLATARWASEHGLRIVLNPAPARPVIDELLELGPILTPNETEAEMLTGESDPEAAARILSDRSGAAVVVTLGSEGALLWADGSGERLRAMPVSVVDTTGAGDALNGILAAELSRGADLREALRWAMVGATLKTTQAGAQAGLPTREAIAARMAEA